MLEWIMQPWPWYVTGPALGLMIPLLLLSTGKSWGISGSFRNINAMCAPRTKLPYLQFDWRSSAWKVILAVGVVIGGFIANYLLSPEPVPFLPDIYFSVKGVLLLSAGGLLIGFGTRYADGCTSGHTLMGLSNLQMTSLIATICFFIGGLIMTWLIMPLLV